MERRGERLTWKDGESIARMMRNGFELDFSVKTMEQPVIDPESGTLLLTQCELLAIPVRRPATKLPDPVGASCLSNMPLEGFIAEADHGDANLRNIYAEKCAKTALEMLASRHPGLMR
jgi:hypothetical protein